MQRREFFHLGAAAALALPLRRRHEPARIAIVPPHDIRGAAAASALRGAEFGLIEATHTWTLLGRDLARTGADDPAAVAIVTLADLVLDHPLIVDGRARASCDAGSTFRVGQPAADRVLWHPTLERFGATQLNQRFRERFGAPMDEHAWAGWFAAKAVAEAMLRARSAEAATVAAWLGSTRARFDGHKGVPLHFDERRVLLQPTYTLDAAGVTPPPSGNACAH